MLAIEALCLQCQRFVEFFYVEWLQSAISLRYHTARLVRKSNAVVGLQLLEACRLVLLFHVFARLYHNF